MRKFLVPLLLATAVATPALAQQTDSDARAAAREARQEARAEAKAERQQSSDNARPERMERSAPTFQAPERTFTPPPSAEVRERTFTPPSNMQPEGRPNFERPNNDRQQWTRPDRTPAPESNSGVDERNANRQWSRPSPAADSGNHPTFDRRDADQRRWGRPVPDTEQPQSGTDGRTRSDSVANWRQEQRDRIRQDRIGEEAAGGRVTPPAYARPDRPAPAPQTAYHYDRSRTPQWNTNWHSDRRYNWRDYRNRHRSVFRLGIYYDPFGWNYQRYGIGWRLWPSYYDSSYWLNDPYMYDLPYAPWPYKWVRYYDDALLVNVFTGQVVDVMYDFFW